MQNRHGPTASQPWLLQRRREHMYQMNLTELVGRGLFETFVVGARGFVGFALHHI